MGECSRGGVGAPDAAVSCSPAGSERLCPTQTQPGSLRTESGDFLREACRCSPARFADCLSSPQDATPHAHHAIPGPTLPRRARHSAPPGNPRPAGSGGRALPHPLPGDPRREPLPSAAHAASAHPGTRDRLAPACVLRLHRTTRDRLAHEGARHRLRLPIRDRLPPASAMLPFHLAMLATSGGRDTPGPSRLSGPVIPGG